MKAAIIFAILLIFSTTAFSQWEKTIEDIDASYRLGDYVGAGNAIEKFKKKLVKKEGENNQWMVVYYLKAARNDQATGNLKDFEANVTKARETSEKVFTATSEKHAYTLLDIVNLSIEYGNYNRALNNLKQAEEILKEKGDLSDDDQARMDFQYASISTGKGYYTEAIEFIDSHMDYYKSRAISKISYVDPKTGKLKSRKLSDQELYERYGEYANLLNLKAKAFWKRGSFNSADSAFERTEQWITDTKELGRSSLAYVQNLLWHWQMLSEYGVDPKVARTNFENAHYQLQRRHNESHYLALQIYEAMLKNYLANKDEARYKNLRSEYENVIKRYFQKSSLLDINLEVVELDARLDREKTKNLEVKVLDLLYTRDALPSYHPKRIELLEFVYLIAITDQNYSTAERYLNDMLDIKRVLYGEETPEYHLTKIKLGQYYLDYTNKFNTADSIFQESFYGVVKPAIDIGHVKYVEILNSLAKFYESKDEYSQASEILDEALRVTRTIYDNQDYEYGVELEKIANLQINIGEYDKADNNIKESIAILENERRNNQTIIFYVKAMETSAKLKAIQGFLGDAEDDLRLSQRLFSRADNLIGYDEVSSSIEMADLYIKFGRYSETEEILVFAIQEYEKLYGADSRNLIKSLTNMGSLMVVQGDYTEANKYGRRVNGIAIEIFGENSTKTAATLRLISDINTSLGDYDQAEDQISQAIDILENQFGREHIDVAKSLSQLGLIKLYRNDDPLTIEPIFDESKMIISGKLGDSNPLYADVLTNLAEVYITQDRHAEAFDVLNQAYDIWELTVDKKKNVNKTKILVLKGDVYYYLRNYAEAEINYNQAKRLYENFFNDNHPDYVKVLSKLSKVYYMQGDARKAKRSIEEALANYDSFIQFYFPALSEREKAKYWSLIKSDYEFYNTLALELMGEFPEMRHQMLDHALSTKALLLNSSLKIRSRIMSSNDEVLISKYNQWQNQKEYLTVALSMSKEQLVENEIDPAALASQVEAIEREISEKSEIFKNSFEETNVTWKDVQKTLKPNEVAIEMIRMRYFDHVFTDSIVYVGLYVKNDGSQNEPDLIMINNGVELEKKYFKYYRNAIIFNIEDKYSYTNFWEPIVKEVGSYATIYLSADGVYNQINLEAIYTGNGKYVIDNSNIIMVSNTKELYLRQQRQSIGLVQNEATMVGNPTFYTSASGGSAEVGQLPGTEIEIQQLTALLSNNGWYTDTFVEEQATEEKVKLLNNPKVFHIATHGFFNPQRVVESNKEALGSVESSAIQNPLLRTGLMLSGAGDIMDETSFNYNIENGILTAYEAMNLNLDNTDLVVLSACETGLGDISSGEGVYGLQRAFIVAGAKTLIMSMFKVNDEATQKLMVSFYEKWLQTGNKRQAFVDAKKELRNEFPNPKDWGAFIMIGLD
jgi:CHAT domain-containing protein